MKIILAAFVAFAMGCGTMAAQFNGSLVAANNVFKEKRLSSISTLGRDGYETITMSYDRHHQLVKVKSSDALEGMSATLDYGGGTFEGTPYDVMMTQQEGTDTSTFYITINDDGFATQARQITESFYGGTEHQTWQFEYDQHQRLVKMMCSEGGNETTTINYQNGDILSTQTVSAAEPDEAANYEIQYDGAIDNKCGLMMFDICFGVDLDEMFVAYFAGMLGKPTAHLPTSCAESDSQGRAGDITSFAWNINAEGYATKLVDNDEGDEIFFSWTDYTGISSPTVGQATTAGQWYDIMGRPLSAPCHGINILRRADGPTLKTLVR